MVNAEIIQPSYKLAKEAHEGQLYGGDKDYFEFHVLGVVRNVNAYIASNPPGMTASCGTTWLVLALLHDVLEDCPQVKESTICDIIGAELLHKLKMLTRKEDESYTEYIRNLCSNDDCCLVKVADLAFNITECKCGKTPKKHLLDKYELTAWHLTYINHAARGLLDLLLVN